MTPPVSHADDDTGPAIGARIRRLRAERSLTQRQLAQPRYTAAFVSTVESGQRLPSTDAIQYFAERLGVSHNELTTGRPADTPVELGITLADALRALSAGEHARAVTMCAEVEESAERLDLLGLQARARLTLARCALHQGDPTRAAELFDSTERLLAGEPLPERVPATAGRARCLFLSGDVRYAAYVLENTLQQLHEGGLTDPTAMLIVHSGLVPIYFHVGAYDKAASAADEALALAPQVADPERVGSMHIAVAQVFMRQHRLAEAEASLTRAYELFRQLDLQTEIGWCHWARGYMLVREDDLDGAAAELAMARGILGRVGSARDIAGVRAEQAEVERRRGRLDSARELLEAAEQHLTGSSDLVILAEIHRQVGRVAGDRGRLDEAETALRRAAEEYAQVGASHEVGLTRRLLGDLLHEQDRLDDAARAYRDGLTAITDTG